MCVYEGGGRGKGWEGGGLKQKGIDGKRRKRANMVMKGGHGLLLMQHTVKMERKGMAVF